ncbi:MAG: ABC transporter ATP-binding protein [Thermoplasmata archaeon HGW-Thermoplasmata-1]|nr:MAG: ABC transporter ATP-binding protein [Thermoplasmata archaeon HGW-Thermoplasmata-1]
MNIRTLKIIGGYGKFGNKEAVKEVELKMGEIVSIVGPTGSGKTRLINDIEVFADGNTPSKRKILINDADNLEEFRSNPSDNPIALITQHTNFLSDLPVGEFLNIHAEVRQRNGNGKIVDKTLEFANQLTGEPISLDTKMTELSGGQTRALLIGDAVVIGNSPILLLDEIENAGIHRTKALKLLKRYEKIFLFVTHDPRIALLSDFRIVMKEGMMVKVIKTTDEEKRMAAKLKQLDDVIQDLRDKLRNGETVAWEVIG